MMVYAVFGVLFFCMAAWFVFAALKALEIIQRRVFKGEDLSYDGAAWSMAISLTLLITILCLFRWVTLVT